MIKRILMVAATAGFVVSGCSPSSDPAPTPGAEIDPGPAGDVSVSDASDDPVTPPGLTDSNGIETIGYPDGWELQPFWSGEYPNAFTVTQEGVTVMGHETITYGVYPPIYCGLPQKATYSPWNGARRETDNLEFVAMVYPTTFTIMEDTSVEVFVGDGVEQLALSTGDQLIYKSYLAEGFFIAEKDGVQYELNEGELPPSTEFQQGPDDQEWVQVTCADAEGTRAWIQYQDAIGAPGVEPYEYTGFGEAADLP
ncbi:MAG: hypothetical protein AAF437_15820 [Pseudomonadota bacterium]